MARRGMMALAALVATALAGGVAQAMPAVTLGAARARVAVATGAPIVVRAKRGTGAASFVRRVDRGDLNPALGPAFGRGRAADKGADFLARHADLFGLSDAARELVADGTHGDALGWTHAAWRQIHGGVEVLGAALRAHLGPDGALRVVNGATVPIAGPLATAPVVGPDEAARVAVVGARGAATTVVETRLVIYDPALVRGTATNPRLAYAVEIELTDSDRRELVVVDALDGRVLDRLSLTPDALERSVAQTSSANEVWLEGDPDPLPLAWAGGSADQVAAWQDEIDGARDSYNFHGSLSRGTFLSFDGADGLMETLHDPPGLACPNASWNGVRTNFCPHVTSDDVVSHEWGHAFTQYTSDLVYAWQPGALNESYSDVWGEAVDLLNGRGTDAPGGARATDGSACSTFGTYDGAFPATDATYRWLVAEDSTGFGAAIRDMWHPECRADPGRVGSSVYHCTPSDGGGVHTNSGVPNHLFALMVDGGTFNGHTVTALGLTKATNVLWRATSVYETSTTDFADHADAVEQSCADLVGQPLGAPVVTGPGTWSTAATTITLADCAAVAAATAAVELRDDTPCTANPILQPNAPPLCDGIGLYEPRATYGFETTLAPWTAGTRAVASPATYDGGTWHRSTSPPDGHPGAVAFTANPITGNCGSDDETGVSYLESPTFVVPADRSTLRVAFAHWIATEARYDGGNVKVSVNGGPFTLVPAARFGFNGYNDTLTTANGNTDPLTPEPVWTGADGGSFDGSWGESQLELGDVAHPGDSVRLRLELGMDGCNGLVGWYVDDIRIYTCGSDAPLCPPEPIAGCKQNPLGGAKLAVKDSVKDASDRLQWSWSRGATTTTAELGDPLTTTRYGLCIWDDHAGAPTLVASATTAPGAGWKTNAAGASYSDSHGTVDGVSRLKLRVGVDGKASVVFQAKGAALELPPAASATTLFAVDPRVTVQLVSSTGTCWESRFEAADFKPNTPAKTRASHKGP